MKLMEMSAQEIVLFRDLEKLAIEAFDSYELIKKKFTNSFGIDNQEIHVYHTEQYGEYYGDGYLTVNGIFKYHDNWWDGRDYEFKCDPDGIYRMLRSCYLLDKGLERLDPDDFNCEIKYIDSYFRKFIKSLSKEDK